MQTDSVTRIHCNEHRKSITYKISLPSNTIRSSFALITCWIDMICCPITESTSILMRLNSSKHAHAPQAKSFEKFSHGDKSRPSEQLNTTHCIAKALARSLVVSVFPVPAGPAGAPPKSFKLPHQRQVTFISQQVITNLNVFPSIHNHMVSSQQP